MAFNFENAAPTKVTAKITGGTVTANREQTNYYFDGQKSTQNPKFGQPSIVQYDEPKFVKRINERIGNYKTKSKGRVLIIQNLFEHDKTKDEGNYRNFAKKDLTIMTKLFRDTFQFQVETYQGVVVRQCHGSDGNPVLENVLTQFKRNCLQNDHDSLFVIIMSHGRMDEILMEDKKSVNLYTDIIYKFDNENFPQFQDKPKIFIVEACRHVESPGSKVHSTVGTVGQASSSDSSAQNQTDLLLIEEGKRVIPICPQGMKNAFLCQATGPHTKATTVKGMGAIFIYFVHKNFKQGLNNGLTLFSVLNGVSQEMEEYTKQHCQTTQVPHIAIFPPIMNYLFSTNKTAVN